MSEVDRQDMKHGAAIVTLIWLVGCGLLASGPALAQANGDPGSALLGIARAQTHAVEKGKDAAAQPGRQDKGDAGDGTKTDPQTDGRQSVANAAHHN